MTIPPVPPKSSAAVQLEEIAASLPAMQDIEPTIEKGFINPADSPAVLAATPEEAADVQGIERDELDNLDREGLKILGVSIGAFDSSERSREAGMRAKIRAHRMTHLPNLPKEEPEEWSTTWDKTAEEHDDGSLIGTLYINCAPSVSFDRLSDLIREASRRVAKELGLEQWDYSLQEYGKGAGMLRIALERLVQEEADAGRRIARLCADARTNESNVVLNTLESLAGNVVRAF